MSDYSPGRRRPTSLTTRVRRWVLLAVILLLLLLGLGYCLVIRDDSTPPVGGGPASTAPATVDPTTPATTTQPATTPPATTRPATTPPAEKAPAPAKKAPPPAKKAPASATVLPTGRPETGGGSTAGPDPVPLGAGLGLLLIAGVLMTGLVRRHRRTRSQA